MPFLDFNAIKRDCPLHDVLLHLGWRPIWSRGDQQRGPCLLHHSERPRSRSFAVSGDGWFCHKCKIGGDQIRLWAELHHLPPFEAAIAMATTVGRPIYYLRRPSWSGASRNGEEER